MTNTQNRPIDIIEELEKITLLEDIPEATREWARDGIRFARNNGDEDHLVFVENFFRYGEAYTLTGKVRDLLLFILEEEKKDGNGEGSVLEGRLYEEGYLERNDEKAFDCYLDAAEAGSRRAYEYLGKMYLQGKGTEKDAQLAFYCFQKNALLGSIDSLLYLGKMMAEGSYLEKDEQEAFLLYKKTYEIMRDDDNFIKKAEVYSALGNCYLYGTGTPADYEQALFYLHLSEDDFRNRQRIEGRSFRKEIQEIIRKQEEARMMMDGDQSFFLN